MCGIVGVIGVENVVPNIIKGLERLEYRGYDSAGIAVIDGSDGKISRLRAAGKLQNLKAKLESTPLCGNVSIGHTRWATHGKATENNAHPMVTKNVALVHNGIVENYRELKFNLQNEGYEFLTETDTEVVANLIQRELDRGNDPCTAFRNTLNCVKGTYAFAALIDSAPDAIFVARLKSPLAVGFGRNCTCIGSDAISISDICSEIAYLDDYEYAVIKRNETVFFDMRGNAILKERQVFSDDAISTGKGNFSHYMLKEIMEQPITLRNTILHNRISGDFFDGISRILIIACGTSYYAGMVARYWFEEFLKIPTDVEIASEYRYRHAIVTENTLVIAITQSGETIDTLEATEFVRKNSNCKVAAIANVKHSAISRVADFVFYTEAGAEIGVASTKAFTSQLAVLAAMAFNKNEYLIQEMQNIPLLAESILTLADRIKQLAEKIKVAGNMVFLGRGSLYPIALEGALKLKEISYIHAEGFAAGEMKHGPIALIDDSIPVICLCPSNELFEKMSSNIQIALARGKNVIAFTDEAGAELLPQEVEKILMPKMLPEFAPILDVIPLQLLAYYVALARGTDIDKPRNLAKSVTVE